MVDLAFGTGPFLLAFQRAAIFSSLFHAVGLQPIHTFELVDDLAIFNVAFSALIALAAVPAFAKTVTVDEYYVVRDPDSRKCTIVEHRPAVATSIVDNGTFTTRTDAEPSRQ
jgi:hypothetical protein